MSIAPRNRDGPQAEVEEKGIGRPWITDHRVRVTVKMRLTLEVDL